MQLKDKRKYAGNPQSNRASALSRRVAGIIRYVKWSRSGRWFVIHARPGKYFGHASRVIRGEVRVHASCTFTVLPPLEAGDRPRATEILILPEGRASLVCREEDAGTRVARSSQRTEQCKQNPK